MLFLLSGFLSGLLRWLSKRKWILQHLADVLKNIAQRTTTCLTLNLRNKLRIAPSKKNLGDGETNVFVRLFMFQVILFAVSKFTAVPFW